jgi:hypothetical protein
LSEYEKAQKHLTDMQGQLLSVAPLLDSGALTLDEYHRVTDPLREAHMRIRTSMEKSTNEKR